jgi:hypothetical protein
MMETNDRAGLFLSLSELRLIFPRLKIQEPSMGNGERELLRKMELTLYDHLSIEEMENLLPPPGERSFEK